MTDGTWELRYRDLESTLEQMIKFVAARAAGNRKESVDHPIVVSDKLDPGWLIVSGLGPQRRVRFTAFSGDGRLVQQTGYRNGYELSGWEELITVEVLQTGDTNLVEYSTEIEMGTAGNG